VDNFRHVSERGGSLSHMRSNTGLIVDALDAIEGGYRAVAAFPLETLTRSERQALLARMEELDKKWVALDRRLIGQLVAEGDPTMYGAASWADVLSRRLRISAGEAQRRITEAMSA
jgi:Domain of unknown function (DUF222)